MCMPTETFIARRVAAATTSDGPNETFMRTLQNPVWDFLCDHYFRLDIDGWHRIPDEPSLLIGIHGGGSLTMDAWTLVARVVPALRGLSGSCTAPPTTS